MGQAKRRGSYEERVVQAEVANVEKRKQQKLAKEQHEKDLYYRKLMRRAGFKTLFRYMGTYSEERQQLIKDTASYFSPPWVYRTAPLPIAEAAEKFGPRRMGSRAKGLSKTQMLMMLASAATPDYL